MPLRINILANYVGQGLVALMAIAFIPLYVRYLGVESYGLIGISIMLQAMFSLLDMGLTPTLIREMARFKAGGCAIETIRDLLRSLEIICLCISVVIALTVWSIAPWIAKSWVKAENLSPESVTQALTIIGIVLAMRGCEQLYRSALQGLQDMVWLNKAQVMLATIRSVGVLPILIWIAPTIQTFFIWQAIVSFLSVVVFARHTYGLLPQATRHGRFDAKGLKRVSRFAGGMAFITLLGLLLTQVDKLLLSKLVSLSEFGVYTLAATAAGALTLLVTPLATAISPRLAELVAYKDESVLVGTYHRASQWLAVLLIPPSLVMAVFSQQLLWAWTGERLLSQQAAPLLTLLALGTMCNGLTYIPYMSQLAYGWTSLAARGNVIAVTLIVPAILLAVPRYGAIGAAWIWFLLNASYVLIAIRFMHQKILRNEMWYWYARAVGLPLVVAGLVVFVLKIAFPPDASRIESMFFVCTAGLVTLFVVLITTPEPSHFARKYLLRKK